LLRDTRAGIWLLAAATLFPVACAIAQRLDRVPEGLTAAYFLDTQWTRSGQPSAVEPRPSRDSVIRAWEGQPPPVFSATWIGSFVILRGGRYNFATISDDASWLYVDGQLVVSNGGSHAVQQASGRIALDPGVHELFVKYAQYGGDFDFGLRWSAGDAPLEAIPSFVLFPRHVAIAAALAHLAVRRSPAAAFWLWIAAFVVSCGLWLRRPALAAISTIKATPSSATLAAIIAVSVAINVAGIHWGLPSFWAGDEITPTSVFAAVEQHFSHGWFDRYPPLHFELLGVLFGPWLLAFSRGWIAISERDQLVALTLLSRLVSVAVSAGTVAATYTCGALAFGRRAGLFAAAMLALVPMFVFYSKTANPEAAYVFWFALSLVFWIRWLRTFALKDALLLAAASTLAVCTKDQAYGLYVAMPPVMMFERWRHHRDDGATAPGALAQALFNWRLWTAAVSAALLFALIHNIAFNASGFLAHVRFIAGPGSGTYRIVDPGWSGRLTLLRLSIGLDQRSWGWPFWLAGLAGAMLAFRDERSRRIAAYLAILIAAYYVSFINVILYNYDRYLLPVCVVQALYGGVAFDRWLGSASIRTWRIRATAASAVFAYSFLYAVTVDVLMLNDSRYVVEQWLRAHVGSEWQVGKTFPDVVTPRLDGFRVVDIGTLENLKRWTPACFVLNADYARAVDPNTQLGALIAALQRQNSGYRLAFQYRSPSPWPWLPAPHADLLGPRLDAPVLSFLRDINPTIQVYTRTD
jgi:4-amino-4-deoxy-L-arabinose transferase-like glycosyltransferase